MVIQTLEKELESCEKAIKIDSKNSLAWFNLGMIYYKIGDCKDWDSKIENYTKAIESFKNAVEIEPKHYIAWYKMGNLYSQIENYTKALESHKKVLEIEPKALHAWDRIAYSYDKLGNHEKAAESLEKAILKDKFRFLRDDVFLCPRVNPLTGKQNLFLQKINLGTNEVEFEDSIDCINTVVTNISIKEFVDYQNNTENKEYLNKKTLEIRSSEKLKEIKLTPEEKFKALKSWAAGIAEAGMNAFLIQDEIEKNLDLLYPISQFLLKFMVKVDREFFPEYITKIERECMFEGIRHESSFIANIIPILDMISENYSKNKKMESTDIEIVKTLAALDNFDKFFKSNIKFIRLLRLAKIYDDDYI